MGRKKTKPVKTKVRVKYKKLKPSALPGRGQGALVRQVLDGTHGIIRLAPTWVPRSFLMPGRRIKLAPQDLYALGANRGGIDERWFASTTPAANEGAPWDEGLSYVVHDGKKAFTLREAIAHLGEQLLGPA